MTANQYRLAQMELAGARSWDDFDWAVMRDQHTVFVHEAQLYFACQLKLATLTARFHYPTGMWVEIEA